MLLEALIDLDTGIAVGIFVLLAGAIGNLMLRVSKLEGYNRSLWAYCRSLLDLYYRHRKDGSPDPDPLPDEP